MSTATATKPRAAKIPRLVLALEGLTIQIENFKESEYDRGTKKVFVNFEHWGWIRTEWHGSHGTTAHLSDLHGRVQEPAPMGHKPDNMRDVFCRSPQTRHQRMRNIGNKAPEPIRTTDSLILEMIANAIKKGWFRSPVTRNLEIGRARAESEKRRDTFNRKAELAWNKKIDAIMYLGLSVSTDSHVQFDAKILRDAISAAMKWAQSQ